MKRVLIGGSVAYTTAASPELVAAGAFGLYGLVGGKLTLSSDGTGLDGECSLVLGRASSNGGPIIVPFYAGGITYNKGVYRAGASFSATFTVPTPTTSSDHCILINKKGVGYNEKSSWNISVYVSRSSTTATEVAASIVAQINAHTDLDVTASNSSAAVTIAGNTVGDDYSLSFSEGFYGVSTSSLTNGKTPLFDAAHIAKMANAAIAEFGIVGTDSDSRDLYPSYPIDPLKGASSTDVGYTVFSLKFAEPRKTRPTDVLINQTIQLALPTGASAIASLVSILDVLCGYAVIDD